MERAISALGLVVFVGLSYAFSINRRAIKWRLLLWGIALQLIFALSILKTTVGFAVVPSIAITRSPPKNAPGVWFVACGRATRTG